MSNDLDSSLANLVGSKLARLVKEYLFKGGEKPLQVCFVLFRFGDEQWDSEEVSKVSVHPPLTAQQTPPHD